MKIGVMGTGVVGKAIASKLVALGHDVMMGSRTADNPKATGWANQAVPRGRAGTFADTVAFGELVFNCTHGDISVAALQAAGTENLNGKIVIDVANILPPVEGVSESLGEQIQKAFPLARVVKTLNTINCEVMVNPGKLSASHTVFLSGNDEGAKKAVRSLLEAFGWSDILDLGDITTARASERYLPLWLAAAKSLGTVAFNVKIVR
jgi:predicted dinucleotide-binding enzyme